MTGNFSWGGSNSLKQTYIGGGGGIGTCETNRDEQRGEAQKLEFTPYNSGGRPHILENFKIIQHTLFVYSQQ